MLAPCCTKADPNLNYTLLIHKDGYNLTKKDLLLMPLFSAYAWRHCEISKTHADYFWAHRAFAYLEALPIIGLVVSIAEVIAAYVYATYFVTHPLHPILEQLNLPQAPAPASQGLDQLINDFQQISAKAKSPIKVDAISIAQFIAKGGKIKILNYTDVFYLKKDRQHIVGCSAGVNRSQVLYAYLVQLGIKPLVPPIAGRDSGINHQIPDPWLGCFKGIEEFEKVMHCKHTRQFGWDKTAELDITGYQQISVQQLQQIRKFYSDFVQNLEPCTILGFSSTPESFILRLLETKQNLEGFEIVYIPHGDTIQYCLPNFKAHSVEAYQDFYSKMQAMFKIEGI